MLVLVVEDDEDYAEIISQTLKRESHDVVVAGTASAALRFTSNKQPALAVLDVALPDGNGLEVCRRLREHQPELPVIFLSSLDRSTDVVAGLNAGGDDYVTKPFHPSELLARVRAVTRRSHPGEAHDPAAPPRIQAMGLELDTVNQAAYLDGINLNLTRLEFDVLCQLAKYPGQVLSHAFLSEQVWGYKNVNDATLLKGHVSSIRSKIRNAGGDEEMIHTVHGVGYSFTPV
ncbi:MAG: response regulator transcription factor [Dehalococcoidia bacterium]|nr:response regulator transcription factor [Dehalococcoidia bacterium]